MERTSIIRKYWLFFQKKSVNFKKNLYFLKNNLYFFKKSVIFGKITILFFKKIRTKDNFFLTILTFLMKAMDAQ